jgi:diadenosine tetraphosphate (Ap4A) HIT family hydrolase
MSESVPVAKRAFDFEAYARRVQDGPCFVCAILAGHQDYEHRVLYDDEHTIAFLTRYPPLLGYCLVAPKRHVEGLVQDLDVEEYLRLQRVVYCVAKAVSAAVPTERVYVLSLGSQQGNAHLHWHVAPLPPGVPYEEQQFYALMAENGVLDVTPAQQDDVATAIRRELVARLDVPRTPVLESELGAALGQAVVKATVHKRNPLIVALTLEDGSVLELLKKPGSPAPGPRARSRRSVP